MRVGILGAGGIAGAMARTIQDLSGVENYAIASRDIEKAKAFAAKWKIQKAYGSYEEMLADEKVDLVYIALPHSHHHRWTIASLKAGRNVLCEKAFAANEQQAKEMIEFAEHKQLLLTEAIWTRYMPSRSIINELIADGVIGEVTAVSSNLGYVVDHKERIRKPELCGGSLLDLTVYPLNFSSMILGDDIKRIHAAAVMTETGVDGQDNVMIEYKDGKMASMFTTIHAATDRQGMICGRDGYILVENINNPAKITVVEAGSGHRYTVKKEIVVPEQITGYEYEVLACKKALEEGRIECPKMPHAETLEIMRQMDEIRQQFGLRFPFE